MPVSPYFFVLYAAFRAASTFSSFLTVVTANSCRMVEYSGPPYELQNALRKADDQGAE